MVNLFYFGRMALILYKSSAGSGKTFTLVNRFLAKVLDKPWLYNRILAITFTNKAAEELKTRIIRELDVLSKGLPSKQLESLLTNLPFLTEEQLRSNAGVVLLKILHDYSSFSVSTIDSYFQKLARTLAKELLLPIKYEIELDTESICKNVTELLLEDAGKNPVITRWLEDLLLHRIDSGKSWNIRKELFSMTMEVLNKETVRAASSNTNLEKLSGLIHWIKKSKKEIENKLRNTGLEALNLMKAHGYEVNTFSYKSRGPAGYFLKISSRKSGLPEFEKINSYTEKALLDPTAFLAKEQQNDPRLVAFVTEKLYPLLQEAVTYFNENKTKYITLIESLKLVYQSGISSSLDQKLKEYREKNQLFHLTDTTRMLSMSIADQDAPFIYEKSGNTYLHIFIDEFQDTASVQWSILKPLVLNALSTGNEVLIVGDAKQSIYRWRGGNMQLLLQGVSDELGVYGIKADVHHLDINWRSKKEIVSFNNTFFPLAANNLSSKFEKGNEIFQLAYAKKEVNQHSKGEDVEGGYICFKFFEGEKAEEKSEDIHWKFQALTEMSARVDELLTSGYTYGDIVILVRTNKDENEIADFLFEENKHPFISSNSLLLSANIRIRVLLNCMRLIVQSNEPLLHAEVNHYINNQIFDQENTVPFNKSRHVETATSWTNKYITSVRDELSALPLQLLFFHLLDVTRMDLNDPFLQKFGDIIQDYSGSGNNNIAGFLKWYDEHVETKKWSVALPDGGNAIRLITIHRSKGLEFPVVFIPFMNWDLTPSTKSILWAQGNQEEFIHHGKLPVFAVSQLKDSYFKSDYNKEALETVIDNLNLIYVAFTRPEEKLFIYGPKTNKENQVSQLLAETFIQEPNWSQSFHAGNGKELILGSFSKRKTKEKSFTYESIYQPVGYKPDPLPDATNSKLNLPAIKISFSSEETIFGNLVHDVISIVNNRSEISNAILKVFSKNGNQHLFKWKDKLLDTVTELWQLLEERKWTNAYYEVENEIDIADEKGMIHRPDKVLIQGTTAIIIDFKTGKSEDKHQHQVKEYCRLLRATGFTDVTAYLIYTIDKEIVKVTHSET